MIAIRAGLRVLIATQPIDFRKGVHSLVTLVAEALKANPYCGDVFIFRSKRMDRLKLLAWDGSGIVLITKWLEDSRFVFPPVQDGVVCVSSTQMSVLLAGLDWRRVEAKTVKQPWKIA